MALTSDKAREAQARSDVSAVVNCASSIIDVSTCAGPMKNEEKVRKNRTTRPFRRANYIEEIMLLVRGSIHCTLF